MDKVEYQVPEFETILDFHKWLRSEGLFRNYSDKDKPFKATVSAHFEDIEHSYSFFKFHIRYYSAAGIDLVFHNGYYLTMIDGRMNRIYVDTPQGSKDFTGSMTRVIRDVCEEWVRDEDHDPVELPGNAFYLKLVVS